MVIVIAFLLCVILAQVIAILHEIYQLSGVQ